MGFYFALTGLEHLRHTVSQGDALGYECWAPSGLDKRNIHTIQALKARNIASPGHRPGYQRRPMRFNRLSENTTGSDKM